MYNTISDKYLPQCISCGKSYATGKPCFSLAFYVPETVSSGCKALYFNGEDVKKVLLTGNNYSENDDWRR